MTITTIDLAKHAVIEASAGTGKTHTIEQLVLRVLIETETPLDRILLVTFTEKATGELKERLRHTLDKTARDQPKHSAVLNRALGQFDQASIFTIHGFCQRLLHEHALEQGGDFRPALVSDAELLPAVLRDVQHRLWRTQFGERLRDVLERSGFNRDKAGEWERWIVEIAGKYQKRCNHQLLPALPPEWWQDKDANIAGHLQVFTVEQIRTQLQEHKRQRGLQSFDDMIGTVEESLDSLKNPDAAQLLGRLRERFRFGIVDEFQDTDPLQWSIFRRIFLEAGSSRLFVVGDPKQAIFGFRGADLPTYITASRQMTEGFAAVDFPLKINWRSDPNLIEALNCVFGDGDWFPSETKIRYVAVEAPPDEQRQAHVVDDRTGRAALTIVDVRADRLKDSGKQFAQFVAHETHRLLHQSAQPALTMALKQEPARPLKASDICILIQKRNEAGPITDMLTRLRIPYAFYKQTGFWHTDEVRQVETLLACLSRPEERSSFRKALLSCFFRMRPEELARAEDLPINHAARRLYQSWLDHTHARRWSALFQSMLEETGLILQARDQPEAELRLANLRHALGTLERVGHGENRDLLGLIDYVRGQRQQRETTEAEPASADTHRPRVQIMTIHASKGLEFPIVFLAGGFTRWNRAFAVAEYRDAQGRKVFNFCPGEDASNGMAREALDEQRRLFYVAMTRPIFKLYVPLVNLTNRSRQHAGPAGTVLLPALKRACPDKLGPAVAEIVTPPSLAIGTAAADNDEIMASPGVPAVAFNGELFPALSADLEKRRIVIRSFSSMARHHVAPVGEGPSYGDQRPAVVDETPSVPETEDPLRGPVFGDIVHNVLEAIDFAEVGQAKDASDLLQGGTAARRLIDKEVRAQVANLSGRGHDDLEQSARQQVAQLVWNALRTPLSHAGGPLWQLPAGDRIHELEFQYPDDPNAPAVAGVSREEGFIVGYMDLVFRRGGRYFLVDFKTNLLPGYTPEHLGRCMDDSDYHRQYELYLRALDRWLKRMPGRAPALGGVYYLFVRGMNGVDDRCGVFFSGLSAQRTPSTARVKQGR